MKRYNFIAVILLSLITCGIYFLHFISVISINNNYIAQKLQKKTIMHVVAMVLIDAGVVIAFGFLGAVAGIGFFIDLAVFALFIIPIAWFFLYFKQQCEILDAQGKTAFPANNPVIMILLYCVPILNMYMLCENYNLGVNAFEGTV